jgi:hypothetical protein
MTDRWKVALVTHSLAAAVGFWAAPREMLDITVKQSGVFTTDTMHILSATVLSLRAENKLLVYSYKGEAHVAVRQTAFWILHGTQELTVPATVGFYLDLSDLTLDRVKYDDRAKLVTVTLPPLRLGDIAFQPEAARTANGGLLTYNQATVDELNQINFGQARRAFTKQAQEASLVQAAQRQAKENVQGYFEVPLRIVGHPEVRVVAEFADS